MIRSVAIFTLCSVMFNEGLHLEKEEMIIATDLIKALRIRHAILIDDDKYNEINLYDFKNLSLKVPTLTKNQTELEDFIWSVKFINVKTIIIFKSMDFDNLSLMFVTLKAARLLFAVSHFTWLIFMPEPISPTKIQLIPPYDCEFIFAYPNLNSYELHEVYNVGDKLFTHDFGTWDAKRGLKIIKKPVYYRRTDMNQSVLLGAADVDFKKCLAPYMRKYRVCNYLKILRDITSSLNFNYSTVKKQDMKEADALTLYIYAISLEVNERWVNLNQIDKNFTSSLHYFPKNKLKWFIKYPNEIHLLNYFARPFNENLWRAIHLTVIIGGLLTAIIQYSHSQVKKISHEFNLGNSIFAACDAFLNQGSEISDKASFRMAFIIFRFTALFIFPAYMADLTALLSIRKPEIEFQNLVEFSKNGKYKMLLPNGGNYIRVYFENKSGRVGKQIAKDSSRIYNTFDEGLKLLCGNGKYAMPSYVHPNVYGTSCKVYRMKTHLANDHHFGFTLGIEGFSSTYARILNHKLLKLLEGGVLQKIEVLDSDVESSEPVKRTFTPVEFYQIRTILCLGLMTVGVSCVILILELLIKHFLKFIKRMRIKFKRKKSNT